MWTIAVSEKKKLRIQKYPNMSERGLMSGYLIVCHTVNCSMEVLLLEMDGSFVHSFGVKGGGGEEGLGQ